MKPTTLRFLKKRASGIVCVCIKTPRGNQWISTGQTTEAKAREVCDMAMIEKMQMAACANALTADVISRLMAGKRITCAEILEGWKQESVDCLAAQTLHNYESTLRQWMDAGKLWKEPMTAIKRSQLSAWVNGKHVPIGTRGTRLAAIRSFFKYASNTGYCVGNMANLVQVRFHDLMFNEHESKETIPFTHDEYLRLMDSPIVKGFWRLAIPLGYWLSLRLRDIACLEWDSIKGDKFVIYPKKTGRRLELPLDEPLLGGGELQRVFMEMLEQDSGSHFCFPVEREVALDPKRRALLSVQFQRLLKRVGIEDRRFHGLRHAAAVRLKAAGKTMEEIGKVLGHADTKTTGIYANH